MATDHPPVPGSIGINDKYKGVILILLALATGITAQLVLLDSIQSQDLASYFDLSLWLAKAGRNASPLPGFPIYLLAVLFFVLGLHYLKSSPPPFPAFVETPARRSPIFGLWITSLGLAVMVGLYGAFAYSDDASGHVFAGLWVLGIALLIYSVLSDAGWRPPGREQTREWLRRHWLELLGIAVLVMGAFLIRFIYLELYPYSFMNDEGQMGNGGVCLLHGVCTNLFALGWAEQSMLAFLPAGLGVELLGRTGAAVRLPSAVIGTLSVLATYLFARETFGKRFAWLPAILLATLPLHIHFSRLGVDNILDSLSAPLILWLVFRGMKTGLRWWYLAAGLISGLCLYSYQGSLLAPGLAIGAFGYTVLRIPGFLKAHTRNILTLVLAGFVVGAPMLGFYSQHSNMFLSRFRAEGVIQNGILQKDSQIHEENPLAVLTVDFLRSSMVYTVTPAAYGFYNSPYPYLPWLAAVFFVFGLVYAGWHIRDPLYMALFVWFWAPVILGSTLTSGPPASQRMLMSLPAVAIITALGLTRTVEALQTPSRLLTKYAPVIMLIVVFYVGGAGLRFYFNDYHLGHYFEDPTNELTYETHYEITPLGSQGRAYLISDGVTPYLDFPNFSFFAPDVQIGLMTTPMTPDVLAGLPRDKDVLFIALPNREADLELIRAWIPGGEWQEIDRRFQPSQVLFFSYKVTKAQLARYHP